MSTPSYIGCAISPSAACGRLWQWSIQIPGLSATNATSWLSPSATSTHADDGLRERRFPAVVEAAEEPVHRRVAAVPAYLQERS